MYYKDTDMSHRTNREGQPRTPRAVRDLGPVAEGWHVETRRQVWSARGGACALQSLTDAIVCSHLVARRRPARSSHDS